MILRLRCRFLKALWFFCAVVTASVVISCSQVIQRTAVDEHTTGVPARLVDEKRIDTLLAQMTLDEKISLVHANSKFSVAGIKRLGIPEMVLSDGPHGVRQEISRHSWDSAGWDNDYATYLPTLTAVAASWDPEIARMQGNVLGMEARARNKDIILGPGVNLARLPLYGRNFEYFGEDPFLASKLVIPVVKAIQQHDVAACVKHYALNTQELNRANTDARPDDRTLREVYLPAFEAAVKQGKALTIMGAYNAYMGTNTNQSKVLVNDILKGEWGFDGVLLTDWAANINTFDAAMNGLDLEMGTNVDTYKDYYFSDPLKKMILDDKVPMVILDDKVRRVLRVQMHIGMMDKNRSEGKRNTPENRAAAKKIAEASVVLLKNDKALLPWSVKNLKKVLVMGPNADREHAEGGGSSQVKTHYEITPLEGLRQALGGGTELIHLRAQQENALAPIQEQYIVSRNPGSGTPAWTVRSYESDRYQRMISWGQMPESTKMWTNGSPVEHLVLNAEIKPLVDGRHTFKLQASGLVKLIMNNRTIMPRTTMTGDMQEHSVDLNASQTYRLSIEYSGADHFSLGWDAPGLGLVDKATYIAAAKDADVVVYFAGLSHAEDREAKDRDDMKLPGAQNTEINNILAVNPNTVVFVLAGSAVELPWVDDASTIVWGWYGGMEGGHAYASVLLGDVNPGGKLPITLPEKLEHSAPIMLDDYRAENAFYKEGVFIGYRWFEKKRIKPTFPFGHGLSYSRFKISDLQLPASVSREDEHIALSVNVKNTGKVAGAEVVQLYLQDLESSVERPAKELKGFQKVFLAPGESKRVSLRLTRRDLAFWDVTKNDWYAEPGAFIVHIGSSLTNIHETGQFIYH